jgi:hypothetical protein
MLWVMHSPWQSRHAQTRQNQPKQSPQTVKVVGGFIGARLIGWRELFQIAAGVSSGPRRTPRFMPRIMDWGTFSNSNRANDDR